jgi:hypothetical protein
VGHYDNVRSAGGRVDHADASVCHSKCKHVFLPLDRDYVPLGMTGGGWIGYGEVMPTHGLSFDRDPAALDVGRTTRCEKLWLYDDSVASRLTYFAWQRRALADV